MRVLLLVNESDVRRAGDGGVQATGKIQRQRTPRRGSGLHCIQDDRSGGGCVVPQLDRRRSTCHEESDENAGGFFYHAGGCQSRVLVRCISHAGSIGHGAGGGKRKVLGAGRAVEGARTMPERNPLVPGW